MNNGETVGQHLCRDDIFGCTNVVVELVKAGAKLDLQNKVLYYISHSSPLRKRTALKNLQTHSHTKDIHFNIQGIYLMATHTLNKLTLR